MTSPLPPADRVTPPAGVAARGGLEGIRRSDQHATLEHLVAYVAHQLGSPLNVIECRAAMMVAGDVDDTDVKRNARIMAEQAARMVAFLREIVTLARRGPRGESGGVPPETTVDLGVVARAAANGLRATAAAKHARISFEGEVGATPVHGCAESLLVALAHILENGIHATPDGGTVTVRLLRGQVPGGPRGITGTSRYVSVEIEDEGSGIEVGVLPRLFKPFTTTREDRPALGLGLFVAQSIARDHGGWFEGANKNGSGARFTLHLPEGAADGP